jgi:hypothetical protein
MDYECLDALLNVLVEWSSLEDEEAYNELLLSCASITK